MFQQKCIYQCLWLDSRDKPFRKKRLYDHNRTFNEKYCLKTNDFLQLMWIEREPTMNDLKKNSNDNVDVENTVGDFLNRPSKTKYYVRFMKGFAKDCLKGNFNASQVVYDGNNEVDRLTIDFDTHDYLIGVGSVCCDCQSAKGFQFDVFVDFFNTE